MVGIRRQGRVGESAGQQRGGTLAVRTNRIEDVAGIAPRRLGLVGVAISLAPWIDEDRGRVGERIARIRRIKTSRLDQTAGRDGGIGRTAPADERLQQPPGLSGLREVSAVALLV